MSYAPTLQPISAAILSGAAANITFSSIPASYRHLFLSILCRSTTAAATTTLFLRFNSDSGANYSSDYFFDNSTTGTGSQSDAVAQVTLGTIPANTATAQRAATLDIWVYDYTRPLYKSISGLGFYSDGTATAGHFSNQSVAGNWYSTASITTILLAPTAGSFASGTTVYLYGQA